jgi:hypothetical protein
MLIQMDGSPHAWLEDRGPRLCLLMGIDDATGTVPAALFRTQEDAHGYFLLLDSLIRTAGRPIAVYHDRHSIFVPPSQQQATLADELAGMTPTTQVSRTRVARAGSAKCPIQAPSRIPWLALPIAGYSAKDRATASGATNATPCRCAN